MTKDTFQPAADPQALDTACKATLNAVADLYQVMLSDLADKKRQSADKIMASGGRLGIEVTVNRHSESHISLVAYEVDGSQKTMAIVHTVFPTDTKH